MKMKFNPISWVMDFINDLTNYYTKSEVEGLISTLLTLNINTLDSKIVHNTGNESISWVKTFNDKIVASAGGIDTGSGVWIKVSKFAWTMANIQWSTNVTLTWITYSKILWYEVIIDIWTSKLKSYPYTPSLYSTTFANEPYYSDHYVYTNAWTSYLLVRTWYNANPVSWKPFTVLITHQV